MFFLILVVIISLAAFIPLFFSLKAKKNNALPSTNIATLSSPTNTQTPPEFTIELNALPSLFQQIILDIESQFFEITQKNAQNVITTESYLTAKRLFYTRLPELVNDYLKLEPNYAKNQVIDVSQGFTSFDVVQRQLKSMLNLFHQINQSSNEMYLQNILTNDRYLASIQQSQGLNNTTNSRSNMTANNFTSPFDEPQAYQDSDYQAGRDYLNHYVAAQQRFSDEVVRKIGQLVYFASITQLATDEALGTALAKLSISANLELEALSNFLAYQLPTALQHLSASNTAPTWLPAIDKLLVILQQIIDTLDKNLPTADKLALIQNFHDDFEQTVKENF